MADPLLTGSLTGWGFAATQLTTKSTWSSLKVWGRNVSSSILLLNGITTSFVYVYANSSPAVVSSKQAASSQHLLSVFLRNMD